jgi:26S proteasome regulatory subunit N6
LLYDTLLEQNLVRVIEPYSSVELSWIAQEVGQSLQVVEEKWVHHVIVAPIRFGADSRDTG